MRQISPSTSCTLTEAVFGCAHGRGDRPALIDLGAGVAYGYRRLAGEVMRGASGLVRRGARRRQVAGIHVDGAAPQTLAVHTVIAAGGVAAPITSGSDEMTDLLKEWDARLLITTPRLAEASLRAVEDSRVRQVIALGPARDTVDFADLLLLEPVPLPFLDPTVQPALLTEDGSVLTHQDLLARMHELDRTAELGRSDVLLVTWPLGRSLAVTTLVGLALMRGSMVVSASDPSPTELSATIRDFGVTVVALPDGAVQRL
ncbi:long-subunit acyl-CoA synthetase (AMP-forming) [Streptosporangium becharense]|uniref:Long-subunit acyl-CoA synthetase (AMP-forming) n=1 Tax=Streptosporangium becharense TaxID=1816182 RepID=A0A7W9MHX1_9ACTN|nr:AMP-binding protein [Streptosporangium becharense]MBB2911380.1 long-subunit acyl-CoA synthetase (AMP-forming) [Streptosporangium becharense]MBB5821562.1 long-subunit acyl-CoA synthetase (AMP-forming) [Streptosporangium becharense]